MDQKRKKLGHFANFLSAFVLLFLFAFPASSQIFSVPVSNSVVRGTLLVDGRPATEDRPAIEDRLVEFSVREGAMLTFQDESSKAWFGVLPLIKRPRQKITLNVFDISAQSNGSSAAKMDDETTTTVALGEATKIKGVTITIRAVSDESFPTVRLVNPHGLAPEDLQKLYGGAGRSLCGLICGDLTISANSVKVADCGACTGIR